MVKNGVKLRFWIIDQATYGCISDAFQKTYADTLNALHPTIQDVLERNHVRFIAARNSIADGIPILASIRNPSDPYAREYKDIGGVCCQTASGRVDIVVSEYEGLMDADGRRSAQKNHAPDATLRHEIGHAVDRLYGAVSETEMFRAAFDRDVARMKQDVRDSETMKYFTPPFEGAQAEVFAELHADINGGPMVEGRFAVARHFPSCADLVYSFDQSLKNGEEPRLQPRTSLMDDIRRFARSLTDQPPPASDALILPKPAPLAYKSGMDLKIPGLRAWGLKQPMLLQEIAAIEVALTPFAHTSIKGLSSHIALCHILAPERRAQHIHTPHEWGTQVFYAFYDVTKNRTACTLLASAVQAYLEAEAGMAHKMTLAPICKTRTSIGTSAPRR